MNNDLIPECFLEATISILPKQSRHKNKRLLKFSLDLKKGIKLIRKKLAFFQIHGGTWNYGLQFFGII